MTTETAEHTEKNKTMMRHYRLPSWFCLFAIPLLLLACTARPATPTVQPGVLTPSLTPVTATPPSPSPTPRPLEPTPTATPDYERPEISWDNYSRLQILAQWSTGQEDSQYSWSPDGSRLLMVSKTVTRMIDLGTFEQLWEAPGGVTGDFSGDGSQVGIQTGDATMVYSAASGKPDQDMPFTPGRTTQMLQPVKSYNGNFDLHTGYSFNPTGVNILSAVIREGGNQRDLRFYLSDSPCPQKIFTGLPEGIQAYSVSPDNRLVLIKAQGSNGKRDYQTVILGINSGFEEPLPVQNPEGLQTGFQPTRPGLNLAQILPVIFVPYNGKYEYPLPIDKPSKPEEAYRLKTWNAGDAEDTLRQLVEYAAANDVYGPADGRGSFTKAQEPLRLAAQEYLSRFPSSTNRAAIGWRLAMSDSFLNRRASDTWMANQLEQALNQGVVTLDPLSLNAALEPFGFYVETSLHKPGTTSGQLHKSECDPDAMPSAPSQADNIFGDHRRSQVMIITPIGADVGMVLAVHQNAGGQYRVIPVAEKWKFSTGVNQEIEMVDITGDNRPEIRLDTYFHNGSMNDSVTEFYQWQGQGVDQGKFVEVTGGIRQDTLYGLLNLEITGADGSPKTLIVHKHEILSGDDIVTYQWDGRRFSSTMRVPFPLNSEETQNYYNYLDAVVNHQYEDVIKQIQSQPADTWRTFLLGYIRALQFRPEEARAVLQPLAGQQAASEEDQGVVKAAAAFLAVYQNGTDLYRACQAARQFLEEEPCDTGEILSALLKQVNGNPVETLEAEGFHFLYHAQEDFNGDGQPDWLLAEDVPSKRALYWYLPTWLVLSGKNGYEIQQMTFEWENKPDSFELTALQLPGHSAGETVRAFLFREDKRAVIFRVRQSGASWALDRLLDENEVSATQRIDSGGEYQILFSRNYQSPTLACWNADTQAFEETDYLEQLLFEEGRADETVRVISGLLENYADMQDQGNELFIALNKPRLQYLLGLAYELSGDSSKAASTYYQIWKNHPLPEPDYLGLGFPDQPYAILAREKLELAGQ